MVDQFDLDIANSERDDVVRIAAQLANALQDIYNDLGEMEQVKAAYRPVENLVSNYSGLEKVGL